MILVSAYFCLNSVISSRRMIEPRVDLLQSARVAMAILTADLRAACPLSKEFQFLGMDRMLEDVEADNLDFATHNYMPKHPGEGDYCQVSVFLEKDPSSGEYVLWRRRNPIIAPDPLAGGSREELARGLRGVQFEHYDGFEWYDSWGEIPGEAKKTSRDESNLYGMPEAVRITLAFEPQSRSKDALPEAPLVFRTVVRLNLAASSMQDGVEESSSPTSEAGKGEKGKKGRPE